ncbi:hypothetical protein AAHC03_013417 [Spirometra sp. Aus1]
MVAVAGRFVPVVGRDCRLKRVAADASAKRVLTTAAVVVDRGSGGCNDDGSRTLGHHRQVQTSTFQPANEARGAQARMGPVMRQTNDGNSGNDPQSQRKHNRDTSQTGARLSESEKD